MRTSRKQTIVCVNAAYASEWTSVMLRLLEPLLYRAECRSIIVGGIINVVNHGATQHLFDKHAITCVTDTRRQRCPRRASWAASLWRPKPPSAGGNARRVGTSRQLPPRIVGHPPEVCGKRSHPYIDFIQSAMVWKCLSWNAAKYKQKSH